MAGLSVLSFNVCGLPSSLPPLARRAPVFGPLIELSGAHVVNLQEVWTARSLALIRPHLPSYPHVVWRRGLLGQPRGGLVTFSRVPVGPASYRSFRGAIPTRGSLGFRLAWAVNTRLQGMLTVTLPALRVIVTNTHLTANKDGDWAADSRYFPLQRAQVRRLRERLRAVRADLTVVTGDFNLSSASPLYPSIVDDGWRDPFAASDPTTFHVEFLPAGARAHRIDYVLVHGDPDAYPVVHSGVMFDRPVGPDGQWASDHMVLIVRVGLPTA